jgi:hypothetical protein
MNFVIEISVIRIHASGGSIARAMNTHPNPLDSMDYALFMGFSPSLAFALSLASTALLVNSIRFLVIAFHSCGVGLTLLLGFFLVLAIKPQIHVDLYDI